MKQVNWFSLLQTLLVLSIVLGIAIKCASLDKHESASNAEASYKADEVRIASWNIRDLGRSKDDGELTVIANVIRYFDFIAIQEVVGGQAGPMAVVRLMNKLQPSIWASVISERTQGKGVERYAFLWRRSKIALIKANLFTKHEEEYNREPFIGRFQLNNRKTFLVASFHARPASKHPIGEIEQLYLVHEAFNDEHILIMGDFNYPYKKRTVAFASLIARGYRACLPEGVKTSLKRKPKIANQYFSKAFDNIFYEHLELKTTGCQRFDFVKKMNNLKEARYISDHVPIYGSFYFH